MQVALHQLLRTSAVTLKITIASATHFQFSDCILEVFLDCYYSASGDHVVPLPCPQQELTVGLKFLENLRTVKLDFCSSAEFNLLGLCLGT